MNKEIITIAKRYETAAKKASLIIDEFISKYGIEAGLDAIKAEIEAIKDACKDEGTKAADNANYQTLRTFSKAVMMRRLRETKAEAKPEAKAETEVETSDAEPSEVMTDEEKEELLISKFQFIADELRAIGYTEKDLIKLIK